MIRTVNQFFGGTISTGGILLPNEVDNLSIWYDVSDTPTITKDAGTGAVSQLDDKSGNLHHLSQATGANQPIWTSNQFKGFDVLRFTAGNSHHLLTAIDTVTANDFFAVVKPNTAGPSGGTMYSCFTNASQQNYYSCYWGGSFIQTNFRSNISTVLDDNIISDVDGGSIVNNYVNSLAELVKLNTSQKTDSFTRIMTYYANQTMGLGRLRTQSSPFYGSFDFLELFAYPSPVSDSQRKRLWLYLSQKYSLNSPTL